MIELAHPAANGSRFNLCMEIYQILVNKVQMMDLTLNRGSFDDDNGIHNFEIE